MKTECPQCHTIFKLGQAQLDAADGMVRCGICQHVFNALVQPDLFDSHDNRQQAATETPPEVPTPSPDHAIEPAATDNTNHSGEGHADPQPEHDNDNILFDTTEPASLVPDELRDGNRRRSIVSTIGYTLGSLLLAGALALQFAWLQREYLARQSGLQPWLDRACRQLDCSILQLSNPQRIELSSRNVYTHPNEKNALMVSLTLVNTAAYAQSWPDIQIEFSDAVGTVIAARRLQPSEYLDTGGESPPPLLPDSPVSLALEIVDPGKQALTYEFKFL